MRCWPHQQVQQEALLSLALTDEREDTFQEEMLKNFVWTWAKESKPSPIRRVKGRGSFELAAELGQGCGGEHWVAESWKDPDCDSPAGSLVCSNVGMQGGPVQSSAPLSFSWQESPDAIMPGKLEWNKSMSLPRLCERIREKMLLQTKRILAKCEAVQSAKYLCKLHEWFLFMG